MGKSPSSSLKKKKRSKISSQVRIKKRSKGRTRRSNKLKKLRCRDDSVSGPSDSDGSRSSVSISSSSFEDDYRSKRSRSRTRKDVKGSKKRAQRRSSSCERIEDSPRAKKRKGSKKNDDFQVKKKRLEKKKKKKKSRRDVSVSSSSSRSWSCSTCNRSSDEREIEKNRGRYDRKYKDRRRLGKVKNESKRRRSRSSSSLFCSQFSEYSDHKVEDKLAGEANSRRLRSVITVVREGEDVTGMFNDEHKEEMVYDHDDYPSSRSNDSIDGGSKRELVNNSHAASEEKKHEEVERGEAIVSNIRTCEVMESHRNSDVDVNGSNPSCDGVEMNDDVNGKKNQDSGGVDSVSRYDLESILRQKALQNLRIRRGYQAEAKVPITQKDVISCEVNTPSTADSRSSQNRFSKGAGAGLIGASHLVKGSSASADLLLNNDKIFDGNGNGKGSGSAKHDVQYPPGQLALASNPKGPVSSETNNPRSVLLVSKPELSSTCTTKKQLFTLQEPPQAKSMARNNVDKTMVEATPTVNPLGGSNNDKETNIASGSDDPSSCTKSPCGETSSNKPQDETKEGSQYQQKTMTVMRGGEMVEVSYKVYIPKKAPALARRQLKR